MMMMEPAIVVVKAYVHHKTCIQILSQCGLCPNFYTDRSCCCVSLVCMMRTLVGEPVQLCNIVLPCWLFLFFPRENRAKCGSVCVANHTTPIDVVMLAGDNCFTLVKDHF